MNVRKSDDFIADVERQFDWHLLHAPEGVADRYLEAVKAACTLLAQHPLLGPALGSSHPHLQTWRFLVVARPFNKHLLFYEIAGEDVLMRRALHGSRDLPRRLLEPPGAK